MRAYISGYSVFIDGVEVFYIAFPSVPLNELQQECLAEALESAVEVAARFEADQREECTSSIPINSSAREIAIRRAFERTFSVNLKNRRENENHCS